MYIFMYGFYSEPSDSSWTMQHCLQDVVEIYTPFIRAGGLVQEITEKVSSGIFYWSQKQLTLNLRLL